MTIWRKSSHGESTVTDSDCVELAALTNAVGVRDSKAPEAGHLTLSLAGFADLVGRVRRAELDL